MLLWARRVFDVKAGEVCLSPDLRLHRVGGLRLPPRQAIRNALFLKQYGPTPWSTFMPPYRLSWRSSYRFTRDCRPLRLPVVAIARCCFSARTYSFPGTASVFIGSACCRDLVCLGQRFGIIAPVQAWSRRMRVRHAPGQRLFGLIGSGASPGAIAGGMLARFSRKPVGGASTCCSFWPSSS